MSHCFKPLLFLVTKLMTNQYNWWLGTDYCATPSYELVLTRILRPSLQLKNWSILSKCDPAAYESQHQDLNGFRELSVTPRGGAYIDIDFLLIVVMAWCRPMIRCNLDPSNLPQAVKINERRMAYTQTSPNTRSHPSTNIRYLWYRFVIHLIRSSYPINIYFSIMQHAQNRNYDIGTGPVYHLATIYWNKNIPNGTFQKPGLQAHRHLTITIYRWLSAILWYLHC